MTTSDVDLRDNKPGYDERIRDPHEPASRLLADQ